MLGGNFWLNEEIDWEGRRILADARDDLARIGVTADTRLGYGVGQWQPALEICRVAEDEGFDLLVLGCRGMGRVEGLMLGSVSDRVVHLAKVPVLVVR